MSFQSADIARCRNQGHRFEVVGSDKTPMKRSLMCRTCTESTGKSTYLAYGEESLSWGSWRTKPREKERHGDPEEESEA